MMPPSLLYFCFLFNLLFFEYMYCFFFFAACFYPRMFGRWLWKVLLAGDGSA